MHETHFDTVSVTYIPLIEPDTETPLDESRFPELHTHLDSWNPTVMDVLQLVAFLPLKDQVLMMANLLTMSGYDQKELAGALDMNYIAYRKRLYFMRQSFKARGTQNI